VSELEKGDQAFMESLWGVNGGGDENGEGVQDGDGGDDEEMRGW